MNFKQFLGASPKFLPHNIEINTLDDPDMVELFIGVCREIRTQKTSNGRGHGNDNIVKNSYEGESAGRQSRIDDTVVADVNQAMPIQPSERISVLQVTRLTATGTKQQSGMEYWQSVLGRQSAKKDATLRATLNPNSGDVTITMPKKRTRTEMTRSDVMHWSQVPKEMLEEDDEDDNVPRKFRRLLSDEDSMDSDRNFVVVVSSDTGTGGYR